MPAVNVEQETYQAFVSFVFTKHGKLRGALMEEASAALRACMAKESKP